MQNREKSRNVIQIWDDFQLKDTPPDIGIKNKGGFKTYLSLTTEQCKTKRWAFQNSATIRKVSKLPFAISTLTTYDNKRKGDGSITD